MASIDTLISVSALLPVEQRERFLTLAASFKTVPEDDEYLQILEAIGFMTLLWKEVPEDIQKILEGSNPVSETCHSVSASIRDAVVEAIPSYDDLKRITQRLEDHELALKNTLSRVEEKKPSFPWWLSSFLKVLIGILIGIYVNEMNQVRSMLGI